MSDRQAGLVFHHDLAIRKMQQPVFETSPALPVNEDRCFPDFELLIGWNGQKRHPVNVPPSCSGLLTIDTAHVLQRKQFSRVTTSLRLLLGTQKIRELACVDDATWVALHFQGH